MVFSILLRFISLLLPEERTFIVKSTLAKLSVFAALFPDTMKRYLPLFILSSDTSDNSPDSLHSSSSILISSKVRSLTAISPLLFSFPAFSISSSPVITVRTVPFFFNRYVIILITAVLSEALIIVPYSPIMFITRTNGISLMRSSMQRSSATSLLTRKDESPSFLSSASKRSLCLFLSLVIRYVLSSIRNSSVNDLSSFTNAF